MKLVQKKKQIFPAGIETVNGNGKTHPNINTQKKLKEPEANYQQLLEGLSVALYTCDAEGRIMSYNKAAANLWGREPEIGKDKWCGSWKIYKPDGVTPMPLDSCPMAITLKEGRAVKGAEIIIECPDGTRRNVQPNPVPMFDTSGKMTGAVNMLLDISENKIAEQKLAASRGRFCGSHAHAGRGRTCAQRNRAHRRASPAR